MASPFVLDSGAGLDLRQQFSSSSSPDQTVVFGIQRGNPSQSSKTVLPPPTAPYRSDSSYSKMVPAAGPNSSAGGTAGAAKRSRERPRSASPNFGLATASQHTGHQDPPVAKNDDQQSEEEAAKARRLLRFGAEVGARPKAAMDVGGPTTSSSTGGPTLEHFGTGLSAEQAKPRDNAHVGRNELAVDTTMDMDNPDALTSEPILGLCPDMCPEVERHERERKGDLDRFERVAGNRNQTGRHLAVKKYTRTAEKDAILIRPLLVLKTTMGHLLFLLERDHDEDLLAVHGFLWDRMRAVRMDLRMQHIFSNEAIVMHEQMIRFHILAMHELCEFSEGEGISEIFNAHLNIEQMNKASVDLFQMYEDHAKRGTPVVSEAEFRGYYALLKLDKHPGYRVEPAELSLDLSKMTSEIRSSEEVFFARNVARACRTGNYVAFFKLARQATYLQACLMHAHFSKLRTQAFASFHSALQRNQGIPLSTVVDWLGMEGEDIEALIKYHGFSIKYYEEAYMVKEGPFLNRDQDFPTCKAQLVEEKRSSKVVMDVRGEHHPEMMAKSRSMNRSVPPVLEEVPIPSPAGIVNSKEEEMPDYIEEEPVEEEEELVTGGQVEVAPPPVVEQTSTAEREELKQGHKRRMEELQFEAHEHERRRLKHEADAAARRAASQAAIAVAAAERKRKEEQRRRAAHTAEAEAGRQRSWFRRWRRRAAAKASERRRKERETEAALEALSLGYPLWRTRIEAEFINSAERNELTRSLVKDQGRALQRMWEPLDIPRIVGPILQEQNPATHSLQWNLLLSSINCPTGQWVRKKIGGREKSLNTEDSTGQTQVVAESNVRMVAAQGSQYPIDFQYSARDVGSIEGGLHSETHEASGLLFVTSEDESVDSERARMQSFVQALALPAGATVPLLVLSTRCNESGEMPFGEQLTEVEKWDRCLGSSELSTPSISYHKVISISDSPSTSPGTRGYFSDRALREGVVWLAKLCPAQPPLKALQVAGLARKHVNSCRRLLLKLPPAEVNPDICIKMFNQALRSAREEIVSVNFNGSSNDKSISGLVSSQMLNRGEREPVRLHQGQLSEDLLNSVFSALDSCRLPPFPPLDAASSSGTMQAQKVRHEQTLSQFLSSINGMESNNVGTKWEASRLVQRGCTVEWHESGRRVVPNWGQIFQAIYVDRLLLLDQRPSVVYINQIDEVPPLLEVDRQSEVGESHVEGISDRSWDLQPPLDEFIGYTAAVGPLEASRAKVASSSALKRNEDEAFYRTANGSPGVHPHSFATSSGVNTSPVHKTVTFENGMDRTCSRDGSSDRFVDSREECRSESLQLPYTDSERFIDRMLAEMSLRRRSPVENAEVGRLHNKSILPFPTRDRLESNQKGESRYSQGNGTLHEFSKPVPSLPEAREGSGHTHLLEPSRYEVILDKMVAASRRTVWKGLDIL